MLLIAVVDIASLPSYPNPEQGRTHLLAMPSRRDRGHFATDGDVTFIGVVAALGAASLWAGAQVLLKFDPGAAFRMPKKSG